MCQKPRAKASVAESLPKLVNVRIEPHLGKLSQRYPFHVQPRQVVAPGQQRALFFHWWACPPIRFAACFLERLSIRRLASRLHFWTLFATDVKSLWFVVRAVSKFVLSSLRTKIKQESSFNNAGLSVTDNITPVVFLISFWKHKMLVMLFPLKACDYDICLFAQWI